MAKFSRGESRALYRVKHDKQDKYEKLQEYSKLPTVLSYCIYYRLKNKFTWM